MEYGWLEQKEGFPEIYNAFQAGRSDWENNVPAMIARLRAQGLTNPNAQNFMNKVLRFIFFFTMSQSRPLRGSV